MSFALILLLSLSIILSAQNYQIIRSDRTIMYGQGEFFAFGIDSLEVVEGDSILYPFRRIDYIGEYCLSPFLPSFLGYQVFIKNNGYNYLFNQNNDTIKIKTNAELEENWVAFDVPDHPIIRAKVSAHQTMNFLGNVDSVKTIQFSFNEQGSQTIILPNRIQISKHFGLINLIDFSKFPAMDTVSQPIVGINNPKMGIQNITWFDIFDFQVGDVIHIKSSYTPFYGYTGHRTKKIITILDRIDKVDLYGFLESITYIQKVEKSVLTFPAYGETSTNRSIDTTTKIIQNSETSHNYESGFDNPPGYPFFPYEGEEKYIAQNRMYSKGPFLAKYSPSLGNFICNPYQFGGDCWDNCVIDGESGDLYYKGLGGPYYDYYRSGWGESSSNMFVYFEKGDSTWGTPLNLTAVPEYFNAQIQLNIFPNPAKEYIQVQINPKDLPATFELFGAQGDQILVQEIQSANEIINLLFKNTGIVIAKITNKKGYYNTQKILINR